MSFLGFGKKDGGDKAKSAPGKSHVAKSGTGLPAGYEEKYRPQKPVIPEEELARLLNAAFSANAAGARVGANILLTVKEGAVPLDQLDKIGFQPEDISLIEQKKPEKWILNDCRATDVWPAAGQVDRAGFADARIKAGHHIIDGIVPGSPTPAGRNITVEPGELPGKTFISIPLALVKERFPKFFAQGMELGE